MDHNEDTNIPDDNAHNSSTPDNSATKGKSQFSASYVHQLRQEAAEWRTKYRDMEAQTTSVQIESELTRRGIKAEAHWINIDGDQSIQEAIDEFAARYPHLSEANDTAEPAPRKVPKAMAPNQSKTNTPKSRPGDRGLSEIKEDPVARSKLRDSYRSMLTSSSHQKA